MNPSPKKMDSNLQIKERAFSSPSQQPYSPPVLLSSPESQSPAGDFSLNSNKVSPSILLIIIILAVIFFVSGLLHLLVRFLFRPPRRTEIHDHTALQGQLQQLFHLHDSGVDQSFIDTLPVFTYGAKDPFDCAVCLSEFEAEDTLRLLPKCSHAFHVACIDTWLLSHSTCPLCRASLVAGFSHPSPVVRILESESSREREGNLGSTRYDGDVRVSVEVPKSGEIKEDADRFHVLVKLGKFRNVNGDGHEERKGEVRRCYSMGSFAYVMDESSSLKVAISGDKIRSERDSFSISKIWLRGRKDVEPRMEESRRAFSFRFPAAAGGESNTKGGGDRRSTASEIESQCTNSLDSERDHPSFGRRTLLWFMGKAK